MTQQVAHLEGDPLRALATELVHRLQVLVDVYTAELTARLRLEGGPCACMALVGLWPCIGCRWFAEEVQHLRLALQSTETTVSALMVSCASLQRSVP